MTNSRSDVVVETATNLWRMNFFLVDAVSVPEALELKKGSGPGSFVRHYGLIGGVRLTA